MKILLLDAAFSALPIYKSLKDSGHDVWVMGNRPTDILAVKARDKWIQQDYSKVDAVSKIIDHHGFDYVVPGCTDISMATCVNLQLSTGLMDSPQSNEAISNKFAFRRLCKELDLPAPKSFIEADFPMKGRYICKPVDGFSGRGVTVFSGEDICALQEAVRLAKNSTPLSDVVIESFIAGELHSCSAFVESGRLVKVFYVREGSSANPYAVDTSYVVHDLPLTCTTVLEAGIIKLCSFLKLKDGLIHTQFIISDGCPMIVEMTRRCPGDLYSMLIEYSTGYPYASKFSSYFINKHVEFSANDMHNFVLRHTVTSDVHNVYEAIYFKEKVCVKSFYPLNSIGEIMLPRQGSRAGILFAEYDGYNMMRDGYDDFLNRNVYILS
ncbi:ATP-grasp domain-containing protein [Aquisediminimonas sediminicola]|uniref:ATP-grasp domain-containing protein n=1 Tax=Alteraquisediminimonas sediminicola TaxID=2676787 RepID=UPI001C8DD4C0|nr:hypothetical protein [Aquisediminimonas sediminicola]